jgi:hypothetical protein
MSDHDLDRIQTAIGIIGGILFVCGMAALYFFVGGGSEV